MNIYEVIVIVTYVMITIIMISQYINDHVPKVIDVLQLMNVLPCYEVKAWRDGKHLKTSELIQQINRPVKEYQLIEGILYIEIY
nr:MAG TPA: hypothetical protein [Caudoviricetes sp.]